MSLTSIILAGLAGWAIAAAGFGLALGKGIRIGDAAICAPEPEPVDNDDLWLSVWPNEIDNQAAMDREFAYMIANEWPGEAR